MVDGRKGGKQIAQFPRLLETEGRGTIGDDDADRGQCGEHINTKHIIIRRVGGSRRIYNIEFKVRREKKRDPASPAVLFISTNNAIGKITNKEPIREFLLKPRFGEGKEMTTIGHEEEGKLG